MSKTTTSTTTETVTERYENPDFAPILRRTFTVTEQDVSGAEKRNSARNVLRAGDVSHADYCKAVVLALARYGTLMEPPYTIWGVSSAERLTECLCFDCRTRWVDLPSERKVALREFICPNGHTGGVILTGAEASATDPELWYLALTDDSPPGKVSFRRGKEGYPAFRDLVMPLNFRVFDQAKADEIRALYQSRTSVTKTAVDADLIIMGELGELEEKSK